MVNCPLCGRKLQDEDSECKCNVTAGWHAELIAGCPWCEEPINLAKPPIRYEINFDEAFDFCTSEEELQVEVECPHCKEKFFVTSAVY